MEAGENVALWFTGDRKGLCLTYSVWKSICISDSDPCKLHHIQMDDSSSVYENQSKVDGVGMEISERLPRSPPPCLQTGLRESVHDVPWGDLLLSLSLNPCRSWGFKVAGQLSGSAHWVLIRSHSASVRTQIRGAPWGCWKARGQSLVHSRQLCRCSYL